VGIKEQLRADLTTAMKARDELRASTLRMVLTAITNEEVAGKQARQLSEDELLRVLTREAKKRREAHDAYTQAGRTELADREQAEHSVIEHYLPQQLSDDEIASLVSSGIEQTGASGPQAMGQVMKVVQPQVAGRADGAKVAAEVRRQLGGG
jgi:uncharacterized protein YqeY